MTILELIQSNQLTKNVLLKFPDGTITKVKFVLSVVIIGNAQNGLSNTTCIRLISDEGTIGMIYENLETEKLENDEFRIRLNGIDYIIENIPETDI